MPFALEAGGIEVTNHDLTCDDAVHKINSISLAVAISGRTSLNKV